MSGSVRSVRQSFAILRLLAHAGPMTLSDVGRALGLSPSSCLNLLRTLADEAVIEREAATKRYRLAPDWAASGLLADNRAQTVLKRMRPAMARFAREHGATVGLWTVAPGRRLLLAGHAESDGAMRIQLADGQRQPLGGGAVGRMLAAVQRISDAELARRYAEVRWQSALPLTRYVEEVRRAGERGYAIDDGLAFAGVCSVACAIGGDDARFLLSASVFAAAHSETEVNHIGQSLAALRLPD